jgi:hypothetical protein
MIHKAKAALVVQGHGKGLVSSETIEPYLYSNHELIIFILFRLEASLFCNFASFFFVSFWVDNKLDANFFYIKYITLFFLFLMKTTIMLLHKFLHFNNTYFLKQFFFYL